MNNVSSDLSQQIQQFYDDSSGLWEQIWGEHMHHGYYGRSGNHRVERRQAQIDLIEELLFWTGYTDRDRNNPPSHPQTIIDVGCGIGGSSLYLAEKFNANVTGITLSPVQAARATIRAKEKGLEEQVQFEVADALQMPFPDNHFDLVWSLESGEHMPDKTQFLAECYRVLRPGGNLILATWCHRPTTSLAGNLTSDEKRHLAEIYRVYCLPHVISLPDYEAIAIKCGFKDLRADDWSISVAPFWDMVIDSAIKPEAIFGLFKSGWRTIEAALSLGLMSRGYRRGLVRFGVLTATKSNIG